MAKMGKGKSGPTTTTGGKGKGKPKKAAAKAPDMKMKKMPGAKPAVAKTPTRPMMGPGMGPIY